jgi:SAM-dependent methyltransferase
MGDGSDDGRWFAPDVTAHWPSIARVYDLFLGGKDNFQSDRQVYAEVLKIAPEAPEVARANRRWLGEAVERMAREAAIDQFLDLGSGLPTNENTHEVAHRCNPRATVVYLDNDPTAISHGLALLADERHVHFAAGDLADPAAVLADPVVANAIDRSRPTGIILGMSLHHVGDTELARRVVEEYLAAFPAGSYLAITHLSNPADGSRLAEFATAVEGKFKDAFSSIRFRRPDEIASLFTGVELVEPGLVAVSDWWADGEHPATMTGASRLLLVGLARKL